MKSLIITDEEQSRIVNSLHAMAAISDNLEEADKLEMLALKISEVQDIPYRKI